MTKALEAAFNVALRLPEAEQDSLAVAILEELATEKKWTASFAASASDLEKLADEALADHRSGRTEPLDPDKL